MIHTGVSHVLTKACSFHLLVVVIRIVLPRSRRLFQMSFRFKSHGVALTHILLLWIIISRTSVSSERFGVIGIARSHCILRTSLSMTRNCIISWTRSTLSIILISRLTSKRELGSSISHRIRSTIVSRIGIVVSRSGDLLAVYEKVSSSAYLVSTFRLSKPQGTGCLPCLPLSNSRNKILCERRATFIDSQL